MVVAGTRSPLPLAGLILAVKPLHSELDFEMIDGLGLTCMLTVNTLPIQPLEVGVME